MGLHSFSFSYNSDTQNAEEKVWGMTDSAKKALLRALLQDYLRKAYNEWFDLLTQDNFISVKEDDKEYLREDAVRDWLKRYFEQSEDVDWDNLIDTEYFKELIINNSTKYA